MLGIAQVSHQMPSTLSGGEKSRVALCRALMMRPRLLLADEPTGQLDKLHAHEVGELLREVNQHLGMTIVLVTHDAELASVAPTRYQLANGRLMPQTTA
jgi:ABC-type lipoprotein export system ATPase subunit